MRRRPGYGKSLRRLCDEDGQTLPWMALLIVLLMGMGGLSTDLGRAFVCYRELQASTDAAVLAGAYEMAQSTSTQASVIAAAKRFSSDASASGANVNSNLPGATATPTLKCLSSVSIPCTATATGNNALQVTQTVTIPTYFIRALSVFGIGAAKSLTLKTTATAAMRGAVNEPYNIAVIIDTTASMGQSDTDASCNNKRITCALQGVRTLLQSLTPCTPSTSGAGCTAFDQVSLFTYPGVEADKTTQNKTCPGSPTVVAYSLPGAGATWTQQTDFTKNAPTYQLTPYLNDYSSTWSYNGALSTASQLTIDAGAKSGCIGLQTPGGVQTYFAGAIYAAQSSLMAAQTAALAKNVNTLNAMIILSDGDANSSNICAVWSTTNPSQCKTYAANNGNVYGSAQDQCQQAIAAAQYATGQGTTVYTIAYGASSQGANGSPKGCQTDTTGTQKNISPCSTMRQMASAPADFYSDATASQNPGQCISASNPGLTLNNIFKQITYNLTVPRLIPNNSQ